MYVVVLLYMFFFKVLEGCVIVVVLCGSVLAVLCVCVWF